MAIQLGTVAPIGFDEFPPTQWLACLRELGCGVVQVYRNRKADVSVRQMQEAIEAGGMPCDSLHGVFGEQFDPSAPDETTRCFAVDTYKAEGELALVLGGPLVVVHCATIRREGISSQEQERRYEQLAKSIVELGQFGEQIGVRYAWENLPAYHALGSDVGRIASVLTELGAPNTGMCFDSGHANMVGDAAEAFRQSSRQVIYIHFSDNNGESDDHEMPTYGTLDVNAFASALSQSAYSGTLMLEVFQELDRLKEMIDEGCGRRLADILTIANSKDSAD